MSTERTFWDKSHRMKLRIHHLLVLFLVGAAVVVAFGNPREPVTLRSVQTLSETTTKQIEFEIASFVESVIVGIAKNTARKHAYVCVTKFVSNCRDTEIDLAGYTDAIEFIRRRFADYEITQRDVYFDPPTKGIRLKISWSVTKPAVYTQTATIGIPAAAADEINKSDYPAATRFRNVVTY